MNFSRAFTLIELLIVIAISAILVASTTISFSNMIGKNKAIAGSNQIIAALQLARSTAITHNTDVIFCKSKDLKTCGGEWSNGQILITKNGQILQVFYFSPHDFLSWNGSLGKNDGITFTPTGATNGQQGTFYYCPNNSSKNAIAIILAKTGRIRTVTTNRCR